MTTSRQVRVGVDTGGTFTDLLLYDPARGRLESYKLPSTPADPSEAVLAGLRALLLRVYGGDRGGAALDVVHGSTVATNAVLEGKGARTAFVTTAGFEDTLHIARQDRPVLYALEASRPPVPVDRALCFGVRERLRVDGSVLTPLAEEEKASLCEALRESGVEAIAVSLLHSYANGAHEAQLLTWFEEVLPEVAVTVSHELLPEFREYERASTCVVNALVSPVMRRYLGHLEEGLGGIRLRVMASTGGSLPPAVIRAQPVQTILSGPAGGVLGAQEMARKAGEARLIAFDMGGTSTDVSLCDGELGHRAEGEIAGLPLRLPMLDIHTVGAGGGSVAWLDTGGALRVGPASMGATPGPACYGHQRAPYVPTVTDAHVVLGHLRAGQLLDGEMPLHEDRARAALEPLAAQLSLSVEALAGGILRIAEATMTRAIQKISVQRGHDPRAFVLVCFGGAGGLHACRLAQQLEIRTVLVPRYPGLLSAFGMLCSAPLYHFSRGLMVQLEAPTTGGAVLEAHPAVQEAQAALRELAEQALAAEGIPQEDRQFAAALDLRYAGQSYELTIPYAEGDVASTFRALHEKLYGTNPTDTALELITARLRASGPGLEVGLARLAKREGALPANLLQERIVYVDEQAQSWSTVQREKLCAGDRLEGPLIVGEYSATTVVLAGWRLEVEPSGQLRLERQERGHERS